jgi:hypothetical protein
VYERVGLDGFDRMPSITAGNPDHAADGTWSISAVTSKSRGLVLLQLNQTPVLQFTTSVDS